MSASSLKLSLSAALLLGTFGGIAPSALAQSAPVSTPAPAPVGRVSQATGAVIASVERIGKGRLISQGMPGLEGELGDNIDGPSIIEVPSWVKNPLGKYYMYFAHHRGQYIRLAYANSLAGPWTVYKQGTLRLDQTSALHHIASPDVLVDNEHQQFVLYYHGAVEMPGGDYGGRPYKQSTFMASSPDGLSFQNRTGDIAAPYLKAFTYKGKTYALAMSDKKSLYPVWLRSGQFFQSGDGSAPFQPGPRILDEMRHAAVAVRGDTLHIFYTVVGDQPERIMYTTVDLRPDWTEWTAALPVEVLRPEFPFEGADLPLVASRGGMASGREHALRDPGVFDAGDAFYLYYSVAGEKGIALARVTLKTPAANAAQGAD